MAAKAVVSDGAVLTAGADDVEEVSVVVLLVLSWLFPPQPTSRACVVAAKTRRPPRSASGRAFPCAAERLVSMGRTIAPKLADAQRIGGMLRDPARGCGFTRTGHKKTNRRLRTVSRLS